jgi:hypothetical protein
VSFADRVRDLLKRSKEPELSLDTPDLHVVVKAFDPVQSDSSALAGSTAWAAERPAVLRHHLLLPSERLAEAARIVAQDGWELREVGEESGHVIAHALRVQRLDALHCAQERARMAGLAQRLGGHTPGWDALQPPATT